MEDQSKKAPLRSCCSSATQPPSPLLVAYVGWPECIIIQSPRHEGSHPLCFPCKCFHRWSVPVYQPCNGSISVKETGGKKKFRARGCISKAAAIYIIPTLECLNRSIAIIVDCACQCFIFLEYINIEAVHIIFNISFCFIFT